MKVLVACEFSGTVRDAFKAQGHDAWSCDILPSEIPGNHIQDDVLEHLNEEWDLMIAHPPCTHTAASGARWFPEKRHEQSKAIQFFTDLYHADIEKVCLEHPVSIISTVFRKPDQYIHPWMFGHGETKKTGLWLKGLPKLEPTHIRTKEQELIIDYVDDVRETYHDSVEGRENRIHRMPPSKDRWKLRSITYPGIAEAMATQWS